MKFRLLPLLILTAFVLSACSASTPAQPSLAVQTPSAKQSAPASQAPSASQSAAAPVKSVSAAAPVGWAQLTDWEYPSYKPSAVVKAKNAGKAEISNAKKAIYKKDGYTYFFDTTNPVSVQGTTEFPICRKQTPGKQEGLGVTGFSFLLTGDFLYVSTGQTANDDYGPFSCIRVKTDGGSPVCIGKSLSFYVPADGSYLYFTNLGLPTDDFSLYRADASFKSIEKLVMVLPDWAEIQKKAQPCYSFIRIQEISNGNIKFAFHTDDTDTTTRYTGTYQIPLNGGNVKKADTGKYHPAYTK